MTRNWLGVAPVSRPVFVLGKLCAAACLLFFLVKAGFPSAMLFDGPLNRLAAAVALAVGLPLMALSFAGLGSSLRMGLPEEETELRTGGIYRISRNPMYLGAYILCLASCLFAPHWLNFLFAAVGIGVHHRIVLAEERFLEARFGDRWRSYKARVRRYL